MLNGKETTTMATGKGKTKSKSIDTNAIKLQALTIYVLGKQVRGCTEPSGHPVIHIKTIEHEKCSKSANKQKVRIGKLKIDNIKLSRRHRLVGWICVRVPVRAACLFPCKKQGGSTKSKNLSVLNWI